MKGIQKIKSSAMLAFKNFVARARYEVWETKEASVIVSKYIKNQRVTKSERRFMLVQILDVCKIIFIGVPFALVPGASIALPLVIKGASKIGINLLPSNFMENHEKSKKSNH